MDGFAILTNRKRAIVALVHSVAFLLIATRQMQASSPTPGVRALAVPVGTWILCAIYAVVSSVLAWLFVISRGWMEKIYFALCLVSAGSGLARTVAGDQAFHAGVYIRVIMLTSAVFVGLAIVRIHSGLAAESS